MGHRLSEVGVVAGIGQIAIWLVTALLDLPDPDLARAEGPMPGAEELQGFCLFRLGIGLDLSIADPGIAAIGIYPGDGGADPIGPAAKATDPGQWLRFASFERISVGYQDGQGCYKQAGSFAP